ncbi:MAG TPA: type II toxin-antitoxin system VapC family toxin [Sphingomicrobium sp.]|nr:type II toxin-antitoxin system VapC family toxin [Sphingomicrobium sp.]
MIILDTNVLSELMKAKPVENVSEWAGSQPASSLFITAVTQAEILYGIRLLPDGRRRKSIAIAAKAMFDEDFNDRILVFGSDAATAYAEIAVTRRNQGKPISQFDAQIAAIARSTGAALATRNVSDFEGCEIELINPW